MPESKQHRKTAERIAERFNTEYNRGPGVDIVIRDAAIEVETPNTLSEAPTQLARYRSKKKYVALTDNRSILRAISELQGTGIGVMDSEGNIRKRARRRT